MKDSLSYIVSNAEIPKDLWRTYRNTLFVLLQINCRSHGLTTVCFMSSQGLQRTRRTLDRLNVRATAWSEKHSKELLLYILPLASVSTLTHTFLQIPRQLRLKSRLKRETEMFVPNCYTISQGLCQLWLSGAPGWCLIVVGVANVGGCKCGRDEHLGCWTSWVVKIGGDKLCFFFIIEGLPQLGPRGLILWVAPVMICAVLINPDFVLKSTGKKIKMRIS